MLSYLKKLPKPIVQMICIGLIGVELIALPQKTHADEVDQKHFVRIINGEEDFNEARLIFTSKANATFRVSGYSLIPNSSHSGALGSDVSFNGLDAHYSESGCQLDIHLVNKKMLTVTNDNKKCGGMNISFNGNYKRIEKNSNE